MKDSNVLIAEFMGEPYYYADEERYYYADDEGMEFHTSWDWLMPVVEKIYQLDSNANFFGSINLEATYKEVVEFIKAHNKKA